MSKLIGERLVRFWYGERFEFERVDVGAWRLVSPKGRHVPASVIEDLPN